MKGSTDMKSNYLIVADDFTGANDTGVQMSKRGIPVEVTLFPKEEKQEMSVVLDTESRNIQPKDAYKKVKELTGKLLSMNEFELVYKKIDSTLRGKVIEELKAMEEVYQPDKIVFAPAFPQIGRTTEEKTHKVKGVPLLETEFAKDPLSPIETDNIVTLLEEGFQETVTHHSVEHVRSGNITLEDSKIHTFDSIISQDLTKIAHDLLSNEERILWVGSAGLANALFGVLYSIKPSLAVVGSISENSFRQVEYAEEEGMPVLSIAPNDLLEKETISSYADKAIAHMKEENSLIITAAKNRENYKETLKVGKEKGLSKDDCSWYVQNYLAAVTEKILEKISLSGIFLTGGATAISVMDKLNGTGCTIQSELVTGTVHSTLSGGKYDGINIITKAGAFGEDNNIYQCLGKIKEMI